MSQLSRRSALIAVPASTAALVAAAPVAAAAPNPTPQIITFRSRRASNTLLPGVVPALGTTFIAYLELIDDSGEKIGDGSVSGALVDIIAGVPPQLVTQAGVIFRFPQGEIHASAMHIRTIPNPGVRHFLAVTGGTGDYRTARGSGTFEYVTNTDTDVVLNVMTDPPPAAPAP